MAKLKWVGFRGTEGWGIIVTYLPLLLFPSSPRQHEQCSVKVSPRNTKMQEKNVNTTAPKRINGT